MTRWVPATSEEIAVKNRDTFNLLAYFLAIHSGDYTIWEDSWNEALTRFSRTADGVFQISISGLTGSDGMQGVRVRVGPGSEDLRPGVVYIDEDEDAV